MRRQKELTDLVLYRRNGLAQEALVVAFELVFPEQSEAGILDPAHDAPAVATVRKNARDAEQRDVLTLQERRHGRVQQVLQTRPPRIAPDRLEGADHTGSHQRAVLSFASPQDIPGDRKLRIRRVEVHDIFDAMPRHGIQQCLREVAMGIQQRDSPSGGKVLLDNVSEQTRLAGAGLADHIRMRTTIRRLQLNRRHFPEGIPRSDVNGLLMHTEAIPHTLVDLRPANPRCIVEHRNPPLNKRSLRAEWVMGSCFDSQ